MYNNGSVHTRNRHFTIHAVLGLWLLCLAMCWPGTASAQTLVLTPAGISDLKAGQFYSQQLNAGGGTEPYTFALVGALPAGLSFNGSTGLLSGTPTHRGAYSFTVSATDNTGAIGDRTYSGTVANPSLSLAQASATAIQGVWFEQTLATNGGVSPYTYALESGTFPAGVTISSGGVISGTTSAAVGSYPVTLRVTDSSTGAGSYFEVEPFTLTVSAAPSVIIAVSPAYVSEDGATNLVYTVTRSLNLSSPTVVNLATGGTATSGTDYTGALTSLTIPAYATTATLVIDPTADINVEPNETVIITLAAGSGYTVGAPASATGTILNDDVPRASIAVSPGAVLEDSGSPLVYTVTLDQPSFSPLSINFAIGGSATNGTDYAGISSPLVIAAGATTGTVSVTPIADSTLEGNKTVVLSLGAGAGYMVGTPSSATGTIVDDELPTLTINDVSANEGNSGTTSFTFTVSLSAPAGPGGVSLDIATVDGTATAGSDYVAKALVGQVIPTGSSTYAFTVLVNGDTLNEPNEAFFVNVSNVAGATVADAQGVGTLINDDALPALSINDVTVTEGNAGTTTATLTVSLSAPSGQLVFVNYATADGTAIAPGDYTSASGALVFSPGTTTQTIIVQVNSDTTPENDETVVVNLSGPTNATLADAQGVVTILNDDVPVSVAPATLPNPVAGQAYSQTLVASGGSGSYTYAITGGAVPAGLTLSGGGELSGTPTASGPYLFTVTATDTSAAPGPYTASRSYSGSVAAPSLTLPAGPLPAATLSQSYTASAGAASGGTAPYSYVISAGSLPPGMSMAANGGISGTPSALGTYNFSVTVTDSTTGTGAPHSVSAARSITVLDSLPVAGPVSAAIAYGASTTPITLVLSGGAAHSVAIDAAPAQGTATVVGPNAISYQPAAGFAGSDSFTYTASNDTGTSDPATVSITVGNPAITVTASGAFSAVAGTAYSQTFTWTGGASPYSGFQVDNLPAGLAITASTTDSVTISGTLTQAGSFNLGVSATDSSTGNGPFTSTQNFMLNVASPSLTISPASLANGTAGSLYAQVLAASGGIAPYSYVLSGSLPVGLAFDPATASLSGTPTQAGSFPVTLTVTDSTTGTAASLVQSYVLDVAVPVITLSPGAGALPQATRGSHYEQRISASGGIAPYRFVASGELPRGISLDADSGVLAGTAEQAGQYSLQVEVSDSTGGTVARATQTYQLEVVQIELVITPDSLPGAVYGQAYRQQLTVNGGSAPYQYTVAAGSLPGGLSLSADGQLSGSVAEDGDFSFRIRVADALGNQAEQAYVLQVALRPDPTRDAEVRALLGAQVQAARRFASAQSGNFKQRMQRLHGASGNGGFSNNLSLAASGAGMPACDAVITVYRNDGRCDPQRRQPFDHEPAAVPGVQAENATELGLWLAGSVRSGRDSNTRGRGTDFQTDGLSLGADYRFGKAWVAGAGVGYGSERSDVGNLGSRSDGQALSMVLYASYSPGQRLFVDALAGYQLLDYQWRRHVLADGSFVHGQRDGQQWFGSLSLGADLARGDWQFTPYAGVELVHGSLDRFAETGNPLYNLVYAEQQMDAVTGNAGLRLQVRRQADWGIWSPRMGLEYQHDFQGSGMAGMQYSNASLRPWYQTRLDRQLRNRWLLGIGVDLELGHQWGLRMDYNGLLDADNRDNGVQFNLERRL